MVNQSALIANNWSNARIQEISVKNVQFIAKKYEIGHILFMSRVSTYVY